jgi:hypothetical protein
MIPVHLLPMINMTLITLGTSLRITLGTSLRLTLVFGNDDIMCSKKV